MNTGILLTDQDLQYTTNNRELNSMLNVEQQFKNRTVYYPTKIYNFMLFSISRHLKMKSAKIMAVHFHLETKYTAAYEILQDLYHK